MTHGNLRFPQLHSKTQLEYLVEKYHNAERIAGVLGCNPRTVAFAMKKFGIEPIHYTVRPRRREE